MKPMYLMCSGEIEGIIWRAKFIRSFSHPLTILYRYLIRLTLMRPLTDSSSQECLKGG